MPGKNYILSPCGTSLLTNSSDNDTRDTVFRNANEKSLDHIPEQDRITLQSLINNISKSIETATLQEIQKMSAELNSILHIYNKKIPTNSQDHHLLLATDTWLGEQTARLVEKWLKKNKLSVEIYKQTDLQTHDIESFQLALSELVKKFYEEMPAYRDNGYNIVFNLTGGFKSIQGVLQSIAHFYADETVYIFESSDNLLKIPRLPIHFNTNLNDECVQYFRNIALEIPTCKPPPDFPEICLIQLDGQTALSPWGQLYWQKIMENEYPQKLLPSPSKIIRYSNKFETQINKLQPDRKKIINTRIDELNKYLNNSTYNPPSLDFKKLKGNAIKPSTHEIDAWSDRDAKRIYGHFEQEIFVLDKLDKGMH